MPGINFIHIQIKYISEYYKITRNSLYYNDLTLQVNQSVRNQYYQLFYSKSSGHKKKCFADQLTKLFFYLHFRWVLNTCQPIHISIKELMTVIKANNDKRMARYIRILEETNAISVSRNFNTYYLKETKHYKQEMNSYNVLERIDCLDLSSKRYIKYLYFIPDYSLNQIKNQLSSINSSTPTTIPTIPYIGYAYSRASDCKPMDYTHKCSTLDELLKTYQRLEYHDLTGGIFTSETEKLQLKPAVFKADGDKRIYHRFHGLPSEIRSSYITLDGDYLTEAFDVHNAHFCFLYCLLDDTVTSSEKNRYYDLVMSGKFYEDVMNWVNNNMGSHWDREYAKTNANAYLNLSSEKVDRALKVKKSSNVAKVCVYRYFEENFPGIHQFICMNKDTLHNRMNEVETSVIFNIWKELRDVHGITGITLHDALYIRKVDYQSLKKNHLQVEKMFKDSIDMYNFIKL